MFTSRFSLGSRLLSFSNAAASGTSQTMDGSSSVLMLNTQKYSTLFTSSPKDLGKCQALLQCHSVHTRLHMFEGTHPYTELLTETTQSVTGFLRLFSAVSFSFVSSIAVICSTLNKCSSSIYVTYVGRMRRKQAMF